MAVFVGNLLSVVLVLFPDIIIIMIIANVVCRDFDVFRNHYLSLEHILL
jgi:hypothetical protein